MKLRRLTRRFLLETAGIDFAKAGDIKGVAVWTPVMIIGHQQDSSKSHLSKSIIESVNDPHKKSSFLTMINALFTGISLADFEQYFKGSIVTYKSAHKFKYKNAFHSLKELKHGKKDRIYLYPYSGKCGSYIFILEAVHKNQNTTSDEVKQYAEKVIKDILDAKLMSLE
ncbi:hypothetical protein [Pseudomonas farris]